MARINKRQREAIYNILRSSNNYLVRERAHIILAWNRNIKKYLIANSFDKNIDFIETVISDFKATGISSLNC